MPPLLDPCQALLSAFWIAVSVAFSSLVVTWRVLLTNKYLTEALEREARTCSEEKRRLIDWCFKRSNAMQKSLWESFLREPVPTLDNLVERTERAWSLKQSARRSAPPREESTIELTTRDIDPYTRR